MRPLSYLYFPNTVPLNAEQVAVDSVGRTVSSTDFVIISLNPTLRSALVATSATRLVIQETIGFLLMVTCRVPYLVSSSYSHCAHDNRHIACRLLRTVHTQIISTTSLSKLSHSSKQIFQLIPFLLGY